MDAVKFIEERRRMYTDGFITKAIGDFNTKAEDVVAEVEKWSCEHPRKTRQSEFLKQFPNAQFDCDKVVDICPKRLYGGSVCPKSNVYVACGDCRRDFWEQEVE